MNAQDELIKTRLINILENNHMGRTRAIKRRDLLESLDLTPRNDRKLRLLIAELRHAGTPILFATEEPAGYYLPENLVEIEASIKQLRSYIKNECMILRALKVRGTQYVHQETQRRLL